MLMAVMSRIRLNMFRPGTEKDGPKKKVFKRPARFFQGTEVANRPCRYGHEKEGSNKVTT